MAQPHNRTSITREIRAMDRETLVDRVNRGLELEQLPQSEDGLLIGGGATISYALEEARLAFLHGFWISAILTSLTALEHHMAGQHKSGNPFRSKAGPLLPPPDQIDRLPQWQMIDDDERERLLKVFECGGAYRQPQDALDMSKRLMAEMRKGTAISDFSGLMEIDARFVVAETVEYFYRHCAVQPGSLVAEHAKRRREEGQGGVTITVLKDQPDG